MERTEENYIIRCSNCEYDELGGENEPCNTCDCLETHCNFVPKKTITLESIDRKLSLIMEKLGIKEEL